MHNQRPVLIRFLLALLFSCGMALQAQTASVRNSDKWEHSIRAFEESDRTNAPPQNAVVFVGSSSIRAWKTLASDFPGHRVINRGFGGSQIADSLKYADRIVLPYRPKAVVFYAGDNDLAAGKEPAQLLKEFQQFVAKVHETLPRAKILFIAIKPSPSRWKLKDKVIATNQLIARYCASDARLSYVDIYTPMLGANGLPREELFIADKLHMNGAGYELWTAAVKPLLAQRMPSPSTRR